jgi:hypothetical protein
LSCREEGKRGKKDILGVRKGNSRQKRKKIQER